MQRRLFLHIGFPKTGTTALQLFLRRNAQLLAQQGIHYPDIGYAFHHRLAHHFLTTQENEDVRRVFELYVTGDEPLPNSDKVGTVPAVDALQELAFLRAEGFQTAIISSEVFVWYWRDIDYGLLRKALADFDVTVIAYLRPQAEFVEAAYRQAVQGEENCCDQSFSEYMKWYDWSAVDYFEILEKWRALFGTDRIEVVPYVRRELYGRDIRTDFLQRVGAAEGAPYDFRARYDNTSHSAPVIGLLRKLNKRGDLAADRRFRLRRRLGTIDRLVALRGDWTLFDQREISEIERRFAASNDQVARTYLGLERLFSEEARQRPQFKGLKRSLLPALPELLSLGARDLWSRRVRRSPARTA